MKHLKQKFDSALTQKERLAILAETVREKQFDMADKMRAEIIMGFNHRGSAPELF